MQESIELRIVITAMMTVFLGLSAWYDANGAEVPDYTTMTYALLGMSYGVLAGHVVTTLISLAVIVFMMIGLPIRLPDAINDYFIKRAYTDEDLQQETQALEAQAEAFEMRRGKLIRGCATGAAIIGPLVCLLVREPGVDAQEVFCILLILAASANCLVGVGSWRTEEERQEPETEDISALGGADIIVFMGMLSYYGFIAFLYGLSCSLIGFLAYAVWKHIRSKKKSWGGYPLLPSLFVMAPVRLYMAVAICEPLVQAYQWAMGNMI